LRFAKGVRAQVGYSPYRVSDFLFDLVAYPLLGPPMLVYIGAEKLCQYISKRRALRAQKRNATPLPTPAAEIASVATEAPRPEIRAVTPAVRKAPKQRARTSKGLTLKKLEALAAQGKLKGTQRQLAKAVGKSPAAVNRALKKAREGDIRLN
jgi:predicted DNA-binding protein (UPF0251 family)